MIREETGPYFSRFVLWSFILAFLVIIYAVIMNFGLIPVSKAILKLVGPSHSYVDTLTPKEKDFVW